MVNKYSNSILDFVPTFKGRSRLDHLDLAVSSQQICDAISYLSTHSINRQSQTINLSDKKVTHYPFPYECLGVAVYTAISAYLYNNSFFEWTISYLFVTGIYLIKNKK